MKIILAGPTGFIGQEVLSQCLAHPAITSIIALSRRDFPSTSPKLTVHRISDGDLASFASPDLRATLRGADACIWTLGVTPSKATADWEAFQRVTVEYTRAAAGAFVDIARENEKAQSRSQARDESRSKSKFRFVYLSGGMAERDQGRSLWLNGGYRRGEAENVLLTQAKDNADLFESNILRPGMVLSKGGSFADWIRGLAPSVRVDVLARTAVDVAVGYGSGEKVLENEAIKSWGGK